MQKSLSFPLKGIKKKEPTKIVRLPKGEEENNIPSALKEYERLQKENKELKEENEILKSKDENEILKLSEDIWDKYDEVKIRYIIRDDDGQINSEREKVLQKEDNLTDFFNNLKTIPNEEELEKNGFEKKITINPIKNTLFSNNIIKSNRIEKDELIEKEKEIIQNKKSLKNKLNQIVNGQELKNSKLLFGDEIFVDSILEFGEEKELNKVLNKMGASNIPIDEIANQKNKENELNMTKKDIGGKFIFDILSERKIFMKRQLLRKAIYKMLEKKPPINRFEVLRSLISDLKGAEFYIKDALIHYYKRIFFDILNENKEE